MEAPPYWLIDRAEDAARDLRDAGKPVTREVVADRLTFTSIEGLALMEWALRAAADAALAEDDNKRDG